MARATKPDSDSANPLAREVRGLSALELREMKRVLAEAAELRKRTNIAPLTTGELVRSVRDEAEESLPSS